MTAHPLLAVLNSQPINKQAALVASQSGCAEYDADLSREEVVALLLRLLRKHRLLKVILQVGNPRQHKNLVARHKMGLRSNYRPKRIITEYLRVGCSIQILNQRLSAMSREAGREARQMLGAIENKWRDEHPGCIWDGRQLVAPNGEVFSRAVVAKGLPQ